jgi:cyclopropane fatty-acyl-phospholipid synthase-like methyltransferase
MANSWRYDVERVNSHYDRLMFSRGCRERRGGSDFHNYGYWHGATKNMREASENLIEALLDFIPEKRGTILDVGCGLGATTGHLLKYYDARNVTGINISEKQLDRCRHNAPGVDFMLMSATDLAFNKESFDNLLCVEAAHHFNTREQFLREAARVLKPGGRLVLSDILSRRPSSSNYFADLNRYEELYLTCSFERVSVVDATLECLVRFRRHQLQLIRRDFHSGEINWQTFVRRRDKMLLKLKRVTPYYVLVSASIGLRSGIDASTQPPISSIAGF